MNELKGCTGPGHTGKLLRCLKTDLPKTSRTSAVAGSVRGLQRGGESSQDRLWLQESRTYGVRGWVGGDLEISVETGPPGTWQLSWESLFTGLSWKLDFV